MARRATAKRSSDLQGIHVATGDTRSLEEHVGWIKRQVDRSLADGETIQLAGKITAGVVDWQRDPRTNRDVPVVQAWGRYYRAPNQGPCVARDYDCEVNSIWEFVVANIRYVADQDGNDTFKTLRYALESGSEDCFALDTKIILRSKATQAYEIRSLEELRTTWPLYDALSYDFTKACWTFQPITGWKEKGEREVFTSHLGNGAFFTHTPDHKIWRYDGQGEYKKVVEASIGDSVDPRQDHRKVLVAKQIPALGTADMSQAEAYLGGIYAAEGFSAPSKVCIAQTKQDIVARIEKALVEVGQSFRYVDRGGSNYFRLHMSELTSWLKASGKNSFDIGFPEGILGGNEAMIRTAFEAHGDGDAYRPKPDSTWFHRALAVHSTSSAKLRDELQLMAMILGETWHTQTQVRHGGSGVKPIYRMTRYHPENSKAAQRHVPELPGMAYSPLRRVTPAGKQTVADISVANTHNFVLANGMVAHNCDGYTVAFAALLRAIGFKVVARVISTPGSDHWEHIYPMVLLPKDDGTGFLPLDATVPGAFPGWQYPKIAKFRDFWM